MQKCSGLSMDYALTDRTLWQNLTLLYNNDGNNDQTLYNVRRGLVLSWSNLDYLIGIILIIVLSFKISFHIF